MDLFISRAYAQVSAPDEPTVDEDGVPDPELGDEPQIDLLFYSTYLAPMRPAEPNDAMKRGAKLFVKADCHACHTPKLKSTIGPLYAYTDLLLHDMGPDFEGDLEVSFASSREFRSAPLWGVSLHGPFLHDGRADTLEEAILMHGGEGQNSRDAFDALSTDEQNDMVSFLRGLGGWTPEGQILLHPEEPAFEAGTPGGPESGLTSEERAQWQRGQKIFDQSAALAEGLGSVFNADSCRACHQDPVLGGAGGIDTNVIRFGEWDDTGAFHGFDRGAMPRQSIPGDRPYRMDDSANVVEWRNPPTTMGVGALDRIAEADILVNADPEDTDGDGISGRARILDSGQLGRFGWKAQVPTVHDFVADALLNETGQTVDISFSSFTAENDNDAFADPELLDDTFLDLVFYVEQLAPPIPKSPDDPDTVSQGQGLFDEVGCGSCHISDLGGVAAYTDLL
ncbi:MAG TPA: c-type cytochrome, partial [Phycisphaerales bacterium]|nr:c-type cytochrome [Phycisphaerales bacterium]